MPPADAVPRGRRRASAGRSPRAEKRGAHGRPGRTRRGPRRHLDGAPRRAAPEAATAAAKAGDAAAARTLAAAARVPARYPLLAPQRRRHAGAALAGARQGARPRKRRRPSAPTCSTPTRARLISELDAAGRPPSRRRCGECRPPPWRAATCTSCSRPTPSSAVPRPRPPRPPLYESAARQARCGGAGRGALLARRLPRRAARARPGAAPRRPAAPLPQLVPVEYGRGVDDGRVTHDFELRGGDHASATARRRRSPTCAPVLKPRRGHHRAAHAAGRHARGGARTPRSSTTTVADPDDISAQADAISDATGELMPVGMARGRRDRRLRCDRRRARSMLVAAVGAGEYGQAELRAWRRTPSSSSAPRRACAAWRPHLFIKVEELFLVRRGRQGRPRAADRPARLDRARCAASRDGAGPGAARRRAGHRSGPQRAPPWSPTSRSSSSARAWRPC